MGRKPGRPKGSGLGEKRKAEDQYSTNPHTVRARKRLQQMGPHEKALQTAKSADQIAISRAQKKFKQSSEFERLNTVEQQDALASIRNEVLERRYLPQ